MVGFCLRRSTPHSSLADSHPYSISFLRFTTGDDSTIQILDCLSKTVTYVSFPGTTPYSHWPRGQDSRDHRLEKGRGVSLVLWSLKLGWDEPSYSMDPPGKAFYVRVREERGTHTHSLNCRWGMRRPKAHALRDLR